MSPMWRMAYLPHCLWGLWVLSWQTCYRKRSVRRFSLSVLTMRTVQSNGGEYFFLYHFFMPLNSLCDVLQCHCFSFSRLYILLFSSSLSVLLIIRRSWDRDCHNLFVLLLGVMQYCSHLFFLLLGFFEYSEKSWRLFFFIIFLIAINKEFHCIPFWIWTHCFA